MSKKWDNVNNKLDELSKTINLMSHAWESVSETNRKASILASDVAQKIGGNTTGIDNTTYNSTTYNMIQKNQLPPYMTWDYWVMVNQWADYWVNRYSNFEHEQKEKILDAIRLTVLYGIAGVDKENYDVYYITDLYNDNKTYNVIKANYMFNSTAISNNNQNLYVSDNVPTKKISKDKLVIFTWRFNNIGDFIWCMKALLTDIYLKKIIECNASHLTNKIFYKIKNPANLPLEIAVNSNPFSNVGAIVSDEGNDITANTNLIMDRNKSINEAHIESLIMAHKHHQEYYYNLFGRVITSSKQQTLSSDANLNVSSAELVAEEHDRRIEEALKQLGINVIIEEVEPNQEPQNENADKEGEGTKNTDMDNVKDKVD